MIKNEYDWRGKVTGAYFRLQNGTSNKGYTDLGKDYVLKLDKNGKYGLYKNGSDTPEYTFTIRRDKDYTTCTERTTHVYDREIEAGSKVTNCSEALSDYHSTMKSESEAISASVELAASESEIADSLSRGNSNSYSNSAYSENSESEKASEQAVEDSNSFSEVSEHDSESHSDSYAKAVASLNASEAASKKALVRARVRALQARVRVQVRAL